MGTSISATTKEKKAEDTLVLLLRFLKLETEAELLQRIQRQLEFITDVELKPGDGE